MTDRTLYRHLNRHGGDAGGCARTTPTHKKAVVEFWKYVPDLLPLETT